MYKINSYVKEYDEFIKDYEDSQKHIKLFVDIDNDNEYSYTSKEIELGDFKKSEKFVPKIEVVKRKVTRKKKDIF
jgi:hypothetical protein